MPVDIHAKVVVSDKLQQAMAKSPQIVGDELAEGMQEIRVIEAAVESQIVSAGLVLTGRMLRGARSRVFRNTENANVRGIVDVQARRKGGAYAGIHEHGGTIRPKRGEYLLIPVGERTVVTQVERKNGQIRRLKTPRVRYLTQEFRRVKEVTIQPKFYFRKGLQRGQPHVENALEEAGERAIKRIFKEEG